LTRLGGRSRFGEARARASIFLRKNLSMMMDCRVKPGNDAAAFGTIPALRSGMKNAAPRPGNDGPYRSSTSLKLKSQRLWVRALAGTTREA
jgi:hypothetical protein